MDDANRMNAAQLNARFGLEAQLRFEANRDGMIFGVVDTPQCRGQFWLHGAHITSFQPQGHDELLFVSRDAIYRNDKAIRGGVPICFPWFGANPSAPDLPAHGWARTQPWTVHNTKQSEHSVEVELRLSQQPFEVTFRMEFSSALRLHLSVINKSAESQKFESALHSYFAISDIESIEITGLEAAPFLDQLTSTTHTGAGEAIRFNAETDRIYTAINDNPIAIVDPAAGRQIVVERSNSASVVVWNPWIDKSQRMGDFGDDEWKTMCCIETANIGAECIELPAGKSHCMTACHRADVV